FLLISFKSPSKDQYFAKWVLTEGSSLRVAGSTNVNKFTCAITDYNKSDTLTFYQSNTTAGCQISGSLALNILNFDCHNPPMTANLRKALKAKQFPQLTIKFISLNRYPARLAGSENLKGQVIIGLAGV